MRVANNVRPHASVVSSRVICTNIETVILNATLRANWKTWIAADNGVRPFGQSRSVRSAATDVSEPDVVRSNVVIGVASRTTGIPSLQRADVSATAEAQQ